MTKPKDKQPPSRFAPTWLADIAVDDDPPYLVEGVLPLGPSFGVTFGWPGSLKSFFAMNLLMHVAADRPFCGRPVMSGAVLYVTSEGVTGVRRRLVAMREHLGAEKAPFGLINAVPNLGGGAADRDDLAKAIREAMNNITAPLRAVVIDTVRRAMPGKAENDQKDMSEFVDNCGELARILQVHIHAVHHSPRSDDTHSSGSNALDAATDVMIRVKRHGADTRSSATVVRLKDGPDKSEGAAFSFELKPRQVGTDRNGGAIMSCYLETAHADTRVSPKQSISWDALRTLHKSLMAVTVNQGQKILEPDNGSSVLAVSRRTLRAEYDKNRNHSAASSYDEPHDSANRQAFNRDLKRAVGANLIGATNQWVWQIAPRTQSDAQT